MEFSMSESILQLPAPTILPVVNETPLEFLMDTVLEEGSRGSPITIDMDPDPEFSPPVNPTRNRRRYPTFKLGTEEPSSKEEGKRAYPGERERAGYLRRLFPPVTTSSPGPDPPKREWRTKTVRGSLVCVQPEPPSLWSLSYNILWGCSLWRTLKLPSLKSSTTAT